MSETIRTYDAIAPLYLERASNRARVTPMCERFAATVGPGSLVVDVGCGPGFDTPILRGLGLRVVGADRSPGMLQQARHAFPGPYVLADMRALPFAGVDALWVNASLLHLEPEAAARALAGFRRTLHPGGHLYICVKRGEGTHREQVAYADDEVYRSFTYWTAAALDEALATAGFRVEIALARTNVTTTWLIRFAMAG